MLHITLKYKTLVQTWRITRIRRSRTIDLLSRVYEAERRLFPGLRIDGEFPYRRLRDVGDIPGVCYVVC